ncbi:peptidyl-tRNA hydrolase [Candidatus Bathyarchaeota archaeon]|nr:peptidyl-tRNA hydrolase [Candidatus Bathyarchaeota archaeon]
MNCFKLVVVVRSDLNMSCGKVSAQVGHAVFQSAEEARLTHPNWVKTWVCEGQKKVVLRANSEKELLALKEKADGLGLPNALIRDLGLTELPPNTVTCLAVGPGPSSLVDKVTGNLKLF